MFAILRARRWMVALLASLALVGGVPGAAFAEQQPIHITGTEGAGVRLQPKPAPVNVNAPRIPEGASPDYLCYTRGALISRTDIWFKVRWQGQVGYYTTYYDDIPPANLSNLEGIYGIHRCEVGSDLNQTPASQYALKPAPTVYNRDAAATWAKQHAMDFRPERLRFADCTWMVSQALWYGGFHQTDAWNSSGSHGNKLWPIPGTVAATAAVELYGYFKRNIPHELIELDAKRFAGNRVPEAQVGDVIFYDWGHGEGISHASLVVNIADGEYPEVAEWGIDHVQTPYMKRGWTWSEKSQDWLQKTAGADVRAYLIHFTVPNY